MSDLEDLRARLANIQAILRRGVSSAVIDGVRVDYDLAQLRLEESQLRRRIYELDGSRPIRRRLTFNTPPR